MTVEEVVRDRILSYSGLDNTLGERVFPVFIPDHEIERPWLMYRVDQSIPTIDLEGNIEHVQHTIRLDLLCDSYGEAVAIEKKLIDSLHTTADDQRPSDNITAIHFAGSSKSPRDEGFQVEITFEVHGDSSTVLP